jgi:GalNAc-alpha-(1->4)-GalNAc-alpha-(1->3)-diNAcBac-PP-undecaprenol alpha-1,4-N-acetyl-D-galactosaminyltransferase
MEQKKMFKQKIKLAFVVPSLQSGGMERVMTELANYYSTKKEIQVHIVLFGKSPKIFYKLNQNINIHKIKGPFVKHVRLFEIIKRVFFLRKAIKSINPQAVLSFGTQWNNLVLLSLYNMPYPVYVSDRGSPIRKYKRSTEVLRSILYKKSAGIIAQTNIARDILIQNFANANIVAIGNPIRDVSNKNDQNRENIILSVGRLISTKHHDKLINIFSKLDAPGWRLIIVGGNALNENNYVKLKNLIRQLHMEERITLEGEQKDVSSYYNRCKIFAFTSNVEGFPNVIGEALSWGLPVVSYDCVAGPSEMIVNGENGFLVPVFDDIQFQEKLQLLIDNEKLRQQMAVKAPESISKFSVESIGEQYLKFILSK